MSRSLQVKAAQLEWRQSDPCSVELGDRYYSSDSGIDESRYVFLQHNNLPQAWQGRDCFTILETGFGTGLNFFTTWQRWLEHSEPGQQLYFISVEKFPLRREDLQRAHTAWPELASLSTQLLARYPLLVDGFHRLAFADSRVNLMLLFGDVEQSLPQLVAELDACYLDGFDPGKNPAMWQPQVLSLIAERMRPGATFSTFTAAGHVRRTLQAVGFEVRKAKGFGKKREMLFGSLSTPPKAPRVRPWFELPAEATSRSRVAIIGAGVAGCATARALVARGCQVLLFDGEAQIASAGSGNPAGVVQPALSADESLYGRFYRAAFLYAEQQLQQLSVDHPEIGWQPCGVIQLGFNPRWQKRQRAIADHYAELPALCELLDRQAVSERCGFESDYEGLLYPQAGYLRPVGLCRALLAEADGVQLRLGRRIDGLQRDQSGWNLLDQNGRSEWVDQVVLASGAALAQFPESEWLTVIPSRGQLSLLQASAESRRLAAVICHEGYLIPALEGQHVVGATYSSEQLNLTLSPADHQRNIDSLCQQFVTFSERVRDGGVQGRAALRATTPDQLPLLGPLVDATAFAAAYRELHHGRADHLYPSVPLQAGLHVIGSFGSRGLTSALLCAELLAAQLSAEPLPLERDLVEALHPARFLVRELKQRSELP